MIKKYVKKPIIFEAIQWGRSISKFPQADDEYNFIFDKGHLESNDKKTFLVLHTPAGDMKVEPDDYLVRRIGGVVFPVKKDIFEKAYIETQEDGEFILVRKDRLEELIEISYETSCPLAHSNACHLDDPHFMCSDCEFNYDSFGDDSKPPVKTVVTWLGGETE